MSSKGYTNIVLLKSLDDTQVQHYGDQLLEYHDQDLSSSSSVVTKLCTVFGTIVIGNSDSATPTALTDCVVTTDSNGIKTVTVTGTATKFFLVGQFEAAEAV